jgi:histone acetyltransferase SAS3
MLFKNNNSSNSCSTTSCRINFFRNSSSFFFSYLLQTKCTQTRPPGYLIYAQKDVSIFEVLGWKAQTYCEDLCLLATLFIESKVEIKNVHRFRFYVLTVCHDNNQYHFAGFFSKLQFQEKLNLSCLLILPPYRNRGFGSLMIHISKLRFGFD